jgi:hypothetical protein
VRTYFGDSSDCLSIMYPVHIFSTSSSRSSSRSNQSTTYCDEFGKSADVSWGVRANERTSDAPLFVS